MVNICAEVRDLCLRIAPIPRICIASHDLPNGCLVAGGTTRRAGVARSGLRWCGLEDGRNLTGNQLPAALTLHPYVGHALLTFGMSSPDGCYLLAASYDNSGIAINTHAHVYCGRGSFHKSGSKRLHLALFVVEKSGVAHKEVIVAIDAGQCVCITSARGIVKFLNSLRDFSFVLTSTITPTCGLVTIGTSKDTTNTRAYRIAGSIAASLRFVSF